MVGLSVVMRLAPLVAAIVLMGLYAADVVEEWGLLLVIGLVLLAWAWDARARRRAAKDITDRQDTDGLG
jgi:hypothetical protein